MGQGADAFMIGDLWLGMDVLEGAIAETGVAVGHYPDVGEVVVVVFVFGGTFLVEAVAFPAFPGVFECE